MSLRKNFVINYKDIWLRSFKAFKKSKFKISLIKTGFKNFKNNFKFYKNNKPILQKFKLIR